MLPGHSQSRHRYVFKNPNNESSLRNLGSGTSLEDGICVIGICFKLPSVFYRLSTSLPLGSIASKTGTNEEEAFPTSVKPV